MHTQAYAHTSDLNVISVLVFKNPFSKWSLNIMFCLSHPLFITFSWHQMTEISPNFCTFQNMLEILNKSQKEMLTDLHQAHKIQT